MTQKRYLQSLIHGTYDTDSKYIQSLLGSNQNRNFGGFQRHITRISRVLQSKDSVADTTGALNGTRALVDRPSIALRAQYRFRTSAMHQKKQKWKNMGGCSPPFFSCFLLFPDQQNELSINKIQRTGSYIFQECVCVYATHPSIRPKRSIHPGYQACDPRLRPGTKTSNQRNTPVAFRWHTYRTNNSGYCTGADP